MQRSMLQRQATSSNLLAPEALLEQRQLTQANKPRL